MNAHTLRCYGTFSVRSFLFHFVLSENNLKTISIQIPEKWRMLILCSRNTSLALNCLRIQCWDYTKCNTETNTTAARGCDTDTCTTENPELGMFRTGTLINCKICLAISMVVLKKNKNILVCWKFRCTKYAQIIWVNRSECSTHGSLQLWTSSSNTSSHKIMLGDLTQYSDVLFHEASTSQWQKRFSKSAWLLLSTSAHLPQPSWWTVHCPLCSFPQRWSLGCTGESDRPYNMKALLPESKTRLQSSRMRLQINIKV